VGNGHDVDGAIQGRCLATYLHGPVLARNPRLADHLLTWVVGRPLAPLEIEEVAELRRRLLRARRFSPPMRWRRSQAIRSARRRVAATDHPT
jgi:CobQ-like glutamine amidotransferase family enzyme